MDNPGMAASDQIKSLIKSFGESDDARFFATAMQLAAAEARQGHSNFAQELKTLIEAARKKRSSIEFEQGKVVNLGPSKRDLTELIDVSRSNITLKDMVLDPAIGTKLHKLIEEQKKWELLRHHNLAPIRKLLVVGPPGTGKTMTAHAIAGELDIPLFVIRLDGLLSRYMGESIAKLRVIFDAMIGQRAVYLFDEFDSIGSHRHQGQDVGEIKRILNSFLINIEKDDSNAIIIAASNIPESLDVALFRRFDDVIRYPLPTEPEIIAAIKRCIRGQSLDKRLDYTALAQRIKGLNFSDLIKACEATIKQKLLSGSEKLSKDILVDTLHNKMT